ncbi:MAG: hypothetical protein Tsb0021_09590 [Chlamydiales bacterium]
MQATALEPSADRPLIHINQYLLSTPSYEVIQDAIITATFVLTFWASPFLGFLSFASGLFLSSSRNDYQVLPSGIRNMVKTHPDSQKVREIAETIYSLWKDQKFRVTFTLALYVIGFNTSYKIFLIGLFFQGVYSFEGLRSLRFSVEHSTQN